MRYLLKRSYYKASHRLFELAHSDNEAANQASCVNIPGESRIAVGHKTDRLSLFICLTNNIKVILGRSSRINERKGV
jgi:hypothetical protein